MLILQPQDGSERSQVEGGSVICVLNVDRDLNQLCTSLGCKWQWTSRPVNPCLVTPFSRMSMGKFRAILRASLLFLRSQVALLALNPLRKPGAYIYQARVVLSLHYKFDTHLDLDGVLFDPLIGWTGEVLSIPEHIPLRTPPPLASLP